MSVYNVSLSTQPFRLDADRATAKQINAFGATVYYGSRGVTSSSYTGTIAAGSSLVVRETYWYALAPAAAGSIQVVEFPIVDDGSQIVKRATAFITGAPGSYTTAGNFSDFLNRMIVALPVDTLRWRLRVANYSARLETGSLGAGVGTVVSVDFGKDPDLTVVGSTARWNGAFKTAPINVFSASGLGDSSGDIPMTTAADWVSPWVTEPSRQWQAGKVMGVSIGVLGDAACKFGYSSISPGQGWGWYKNGVGVSALSKTAAPAALSTSNLSLLDMRIEYECLTPLNRPAKVVLGLGDSITAGNINNTTTAIMRCLAHETWLGSAGHRFGFPTVNLGISSTAAYGTGALYWDPILNPPSTVWKWQRADLTTTPPDEAIINLGINDLGASLANFQGSIGNIINYLRDTIGIPRIHVATLIPRNTAGANETARVAINDWYRTLPLSVERCIEFEKAIWVPGSSAPITADPDLLFDYPHPTAQGYQVMAEAV